MKNTEVNSIIGGGFVFLPSYPEDIFMPEEADEEQKMVFQTAQSFVKTEIDPIRQEIEEKKPGLAESLFIKMGALGFLGAHIPAENGGFGMDANSIALLSLGIGNMGSFNTPFAAHTGIGMLPILYFGSKAQKEKYLPPMMDGSLVASYCLTEPTSGSDALAAKTTAMEDEDGNYVINGQKMWISNAGYAGLFIVFAQVNGEHFTGFLVEKNSEGLTLGAEEEKLGIHGSSTRQVFFENVVVGKDAVLGEVGKGHLIAFNVLNMGRFKLGALCTAGCKFATAESVKYANERIQFKKPISSFGAIQNKLAQQVMKTMALESATFRISQLLKSKTKELVENGLSAAQAKLESAKEYAIECSVLKVAGSESIDYIADEFVQIFGGMGYSEEALPARFYRDVRINRIYEGTNEINRLLIVNMLFKKAMSGAIDLMTLMASPPEPSGNSDMDGCRKVLIKLLNYVGRSQMSGELDLKKEQEVAMALADVAIDLYILESLFLRVQKRKIKSFNDDTDCWQAALDLKGQEVAHSTQKNAAIILGRIFQEDEVNKKMQKLFTEIYPSQYVDVIARSRTLAEKLIEANDYCF